VVAAAVRAIRYEALLALKGPLARAATTDDARAELGRAAAAHRAGPAHSAL
jgi:hypothetical protein